MEACFDISASDLALCIPAWSGAQQPVDQWSTGLAANRTWPSALSRSQVSGSLWKR